jgi:diacylglycerol kinase (ATP)
MPKNRAFAQRLGFALRGIAHAMRGERSMRTHVAALLAVVVALLVLRPAPMWWALFGLTSLGVIGAELFNTALERLADRLHPEEHPEIAVAKDCAAGAVLVAVIAAVVVAGAFVVERVL